MSKQGICDELNDVSLWNNGIILMNSRSIELKRKRTAAEKRARRERKRLYMTIFVNGKKKRVPRPQLVEGLPVDEFIAKNADEIWKHQNEAWELIG